MVIEELTQIGNPIITNVSKVVTDIQSPEIRQLIQDLKDTMEASQLIGIAAPQIGQNLRVFVTEIRKTDARPNQRSDKLRVYINPHITWASGEIVEIWEGCGSVAKTELFAPIERAKEIEIQALDEEAKPFTLKANGLLARCIQHEYDHLEGKVFAFHIKDLMRIMTRNEYIERVAKRRNASE